MAFLKKIRKFDVFREVHQDFTNASTTGAIISIICCGVMSILILSELVSFLSVKTTSSMYVQKSSYSRQNEEIRINMSIDFYNAPCKVLSLDTVDIMGGHSVDVSDTLKKTAFGKKGEGCSLDGYITVSKVPGNFHISTHSYFRELSKMISDGKVLDLSHKINHLSFGEYRAKIKGTEVSFNPLDKLEHKKEKINKNFINLGSSFLLKHTGTFEYYLKIVPTVHKKINGYVYTGYQFSSNSKHLSDEKFPALYFRYEFNPITVEFREWREGMTTFLVKILGVVGGVYTGFSLLSTWLNLSVARLMQKANMGKLG